MTVSNSFLKKCCLFLVVICALPYLAKGQGTNDTLKHFKDSYFGNHPKFCCPSLVTCAYGFVFGHSCYEYREFAEKFTLNDSADIVGLFAYVATDDQKIQSTDSVEFRIYDEKNNKPGKMLIEKSVSIQDLTLKSTLLPTFSFKNFSHANFPNAVSLAKDSSFFASLAFPKYRNNFNANPPNLHPDTLTIRVADGSNQQNPSINETNYVRQKNGTWVSSGLPTETGSVTFYLAPEINTGNQVSNCNGGQITTANGLDTVQVCTDGQPDVIQFDSSNTGGNDYRYIITDKNGTIQNVKSSDKNDFDMAMPGIYHVYGFDYDGNLNANPGMAISSVSGGNCGDLSSNKITIISDTMQGGEVMTSNNEDTAYACIDNQSDVYSFMNTSNTRAVNYRYLITDKGGQIVALPNSGNYDFDDGNAGELQVHGMAYLGNLNASIGMNLSNVSASECYELSKNQITILRDTMQGGEVMTTNNEDTVNVCINNQSDVYSFKNTSNTRTVNYRYIITDKGGQIVGLPSSDQYDFNKGNASELQAHGIAYLGDLNANTGMNLSNVSASECYELSKNHITALRETVSGGEVMTSNNEDTVYACIDNQSDVYSFMNTSNTSAGNYRYLITDKGGQIVALPNSGNYDFDNGNAGELQVHGLAYLGNLNVSKGMSLSSVFASECYELSQNQITVLRDTLEGGEVMTTNNEDTVNVCINNQSDVYSFMNTSTTKSNNYRYLITDKGGQIVGIPASDQYDFNEGNSDDLQVHGIAYLGELNVSTGMNLGNVSASECFELSNDYITVFRDSIEGGEVMTNNGEDTAQVTVNDQSAVVEFRNTSATMAMHYTYVITNANDTVLNPDAGTSQDFNSAGSGVCYVYGFAHLGALNITKDIAINNVTSDSCLDRSQNKITVIRDSATTTMLEQHKEEPKPLDIYPNPADNHVFIEIPSAEAGDGLVRIRTVSGKVVMQKQVTFDKGQKRISLQLPSTGAGSYIIGVSLNKRQYRAKLFIY